MIGIIQQDDGLFAVCDYGGSALDSVLKLFASQREAEEWLLDRNLRADSESSGLRPILPGDGEGLR